MFLFMTVWLLRESADFDTPLDLCEEREREREDTQKVKNSS